MDFDRYRSRHHRVNNDNLWRDFRHNLGLLVARSAHAIEVLEIFFGSKGVKIKVNLLAVRVMFNDDYACNRLYVSDVYTRCARA